MTAPLTPEEREKRLEDLRDYHTGIRPHYEDEDSRECGCGQCDAHLLLTELDRVKADYAREFSACASHQEVCERLKAERDEARGINRRSMESIADRVRAEEDRDAALANARDRASEYQDACKERDECKEQQRHAEEQTRQAEQECNAALAEAKALRGIIETTAIALELEDFTAFAARLRSALADHPERPQVVRCFLCNWQGLPEDVERDHSAECKAHPEPKR